MDPVNVPLDERFVTDLILQRTGPFQRLGGGNALNRWFASGERAPLFEFLDRNSLVQAFIQQVYAEMQAEATALVASLPAACFRHIVSVGPGNGMLELLLFRLTSPESLLLIDIEQSGAHHHGFHATGAGYASLHETRRFLVGNSVPDAVLHTCNPRQAALPDQPFSLLISILSMGFHYPCDEYADFIAAHALEDAHLVIDKRRDAPDAGFARLLASFSERSRSSHPKHDRIVLGRT